MKKSYQKILLSFLISVSTLQAAETIYEDAEDNANSRWFIYDDTPAGATVENVFDIDKQSRVIKLSGTTTRNGYALGNWSGRDGAWANRDEKLLSMDLKFSEFYRIYVILETTEGRKYLYYTSQSNDRGKLGSSYIHIGLGSNHMDGQWYTENRDLEADLQRYEPNNRLLAVHGVLFRGSGSVDNVKLSDGKPIIQPLEQIIYEDGQDLNTEGWSIYDASPAGATINNVYDSDKKSRVIQLQGEGARNGYMFGNWGGRAGALNEQNRKRLTFNMNFSAGFSFYVTVQTTNGQRYLYYTQASANRGLISNRYIHYGLGSGYSDGEWHLFSRDLEADLQAVEAGNSIISIDGILVRGSGKLDDIILSQGAPILPSTIYEDAENGFSDKWEIVQDAGEILGYSRASMRTVSPSFNNSRACMRFQATGNGMQNVYRLPMINPVQTILEVDVGGFSGRNQPHYLLGVYANTLEGERVLYWDSWNTHEGNGPRKKVYGSNTFLIYPSPIELVRGFHYAPQNQVETFRVDLNAQLRLLEPDNRIISVTHFITGGGYLDNIRLSSQ